MEAFNIVEFPAYSLTDMRLGLLADAWDIQLYVNNVFDDDTIISGGPNPGIANAQFNFGFTDRGTPPGIVAGPKIPNEIYANLPNPRIAGIRARFRFGQ